MALDFGNYLLASSPPGFEYIRLKSFEFKQETDRDFPCYRKTKNSYNEQCNRNGDVGVNGVFEIDLCSEECDRQNDVAKTHWESRAFEDDRVIVSNHKSQDLARISDWINTYQCNPEQCSCRREKIEDKPTNEKHVSFADDCGLSLAEVRTMQEPSSVPPQLKPEILTRFNCPTWAADPPSNVAPRLLINFAQPAADYVAFREKVEKSFVSLENAIIRDNLLIGTIKVKNISFQKSVFVRCTFDGWQSHCDCQATYYDSNNVAFDTFSFQIEIPSDTDPEKSIQFAVCFKADGVENWDSNDGKNYEVTHSDWSDSRDGSRNGMAQGVFASDRRDSWSNFSGWSATQSSPYW